VVGYSTAVDVDSLAQMQGTPQTSGVRGGLIDATCNVVEQWLNNEAYVTQGLLARHSKSAICVQIASQSDEGFVCTRCTTGSRSLVNSKFVTPGDVWHCTSSRSIVLLVDRPLLSPSTIGGSILASLHRSTCVLRQLPRNLAKVCVKLRRQSAPVNSQSR
jgi:hypothetical protein